MSRRRLGPIPTRELVAPRSPQWLWDACCRGQEPAEALDHRDREDLVAQLLRAGWSIPEVAGHTRMTVYTTARIADRVSASTVGRAA